MNAIARAVRILLLVLLVGFAGFPIYWMLNTALSSTNELYKSGQSLWLHLERIGDIPAAFAKVPVGVWLGNSFWIAAGTTVLSLALGVLAGYALSRFKFYGKGIVGFLLFSTQMLPEALLVVPLYAIFTTLGLLNNLGGLVLANTAFVMPVAAFILKAAIDDVPIEIEESARIDGCPRMGILSLVVLPLVKPSIAAAAVISFFAGWNEFLFANTFISNASLWPASIGLASFQGQFITPIELVMAAALVFALPAVVFFLLAQRSIVSGMAAGAVKG
ncbi:carbohydrate ABC transporter permease [Rathayibacter soli]|uniref:carbohydrate ABC transporter permease n=1 Tax=Rathayibacter soli TaxID=3144168 RepID=UPI0027E4DD1F|nr:carbohydrate ABC transporter permease [Glaciibacter superstes]